MVKSTIVAEVIAAKMMRNRIPSGLFPSSLGEI
jgi:hypothetical protein